MNCFTDKGPVINSGEIRFSRTRLQGTARTEAGSVAGKQPVIVYRLQGQYKGDCN